MKKNENHHQILHIRINLGSKFQLRQTILIYGTNFSKKWGFKEKPKTEKMNIVIEFYILELV